MKEKAVDSILEARKNYMTNQSKGELLVLIKEYAKLELYKEVNRYIREFLEKSEDISDIMEISENFPMEIQNFLKEIKEGIEIDEDFDADSLLEMGELLWEIGSPEEARDNYIKAFESYNILGRNDSAEEVLNTLMSRYHDDQDVRELKIRDVKGELYEKFAEMEDLVPQDEVDLRYALGKRMHEADLLSDAEENYKRILTLRKDHKARRYLVAILRDKNALEEALNYAEKLEESEKLDEYYSLALSFKAVGNKEKANTLLREIYEINQEYKDVKELFEAKREEKKEIVKKEEEAFVEMDKEIIRTTGESVVDEKDKGEERIVFL